MNKFADFIEREAGHVVILALLGFAYHAIGQNEAAAGCLAALLYAMKSSPVKPPPTV